MDHGIHTLDTVELTDDVAGAPKGTVGAVVSEYPSSALVEIISESDRDLFDDLISVPYESMRLVEVAAPVAAH